MKTLQHYFSKIAILSLLVSFLVGSIYAEETIKLPVRVHLMRAHMTHAPTGTEMVAFVTPPDVKNAFHEINLIWKQANIEFYPEQTVLHVNQGSPADIDYITKAKRDGNGKSDPNRIPHVYNCFDKTKHHPTIQNLYFIQFTGNTSQGYAGIPGNRGAPYLDSNYAVVAMWTNKHNGGLRPERALFWERAPGVDAIAAPQDQNFFKRGSILRTCAHELGHNLTLPHPRENLPKGRLMGGPGGHGYLLTSAEIAKARTAAKVRRQRADAAGL